MMKNKILNIFLVLLVILILMSPLALQADTGDPGGTDIGPPWGGTELTLEQVIANVTNWVLGVAGALAVLFIIISGIRYTTSSGNSALQEAAKKNLTSAIIGLVIVLIAFVIVNAVIRAITSGA